jgi:hypothetical protein
LRQEMSKSDHTKAWLSKLTLCVYRLLPTWFVANGQSGGNVHRKSGR